MFKRGITKAGIIRDVMADSCLPYDKREIFDKAEAAILQLPKEQRIQLSKLTAGDVENVLQKAKKEQGVNGRVNTLSKNVEKVADNLERAHKALGDEPPLTREDLLTAAKFVSYCGSYHKAESLLNLLQEVQTQK